MYQTFTNESVPILRKTEGLAPCTIHGVIYQPFTKEPVLNPIYRMAFGFFLRCGVVFAGKVYKKRPSEGHCLVRSSLERGLDSGSAGVAYRFLAPERVTAVHW